MIQASVVRTWALVSYNRTAEEKVKNKVAYKSADK